MMTRWIRILALVIVALTSLTANLAVAQAASVSEQPHCPHMAAAMAAHGMDHHPHHQQPHMDCHCPLSHGAVAPMGLPVRGVAVVPVALAWAADRIPASSAVDGLIRPPRSA